VRPPFVILPVVTPRVLIRLKRSSVVGVTGAKTIFVLGESMAHIVQSDATFVVTPISSIGQKIFIKRSSTESPQNNRAMNTDTEKNTIVCRIQTSASLVGLMKSRQAIAGWCACFVRFRRALIGCAFTRWRRAAV
jgi:hypothetical protein